MNLLTGKKAERPFIDYTDQTGGSVDLNHRVDLRCMTKDVTIYYTIDGAVPYPWHKSAQVNYVFYVLIHTLSGVGW